jgi:sirohydrochlorin cobaltochelatase
LGLLIVGHGTREQPGVEEFLRVVQQLHVLRPETPIEPCFLEFCRPTIPEGLTALVEQGVQEVLVVPLLLFAANHVRRDIPAAVARAAAHHPRLRVQQVSHLGCHPRLVELSALRFQEALADRADVALDETLLLLVGRVEVCFLAKERPSLSEGLSRVADLPVRRVVVQPHLLFPGRLRTTIQSAVEGWRASRPRIEWVVPGPLGPDWRVAAAVAELAEAEDRTNWRWIA